MTDTGEAAKWFRDRATVLSSLNTEKALDQLEEVRDLIVGARVVGVGEAAHFIDEFTAARQLLLRFLTERCGFSVLAFEVGFAEALPIAPWLRGEGNDEALTEFMSTTNVWVGGKLKQWLRQHNMTSDTVVDFVGIDVPDAGGQLRPALEPVADYLAEVDPEALPRLETALRISDKFVGGSAAAAAPEWGKLPDRDRDALTASLARLRERALGLRDLYIERSDAETFELHARLLEAACATDYMFSAMHDVFSGGGLSADTSVRERFMAESVLWHMDRHPGDRFIVMAHNNHIQKTSISFAGHLFGIPMGQQLHAALGVDYRAIALTHTAEQTPEMFPDTTVEPGFRVEEIQLERPVPGSVEATLIDADLGREISISNLRNFPDDIELSSIRTQGATMETSITEAFDGVLCSPTATTDDSVIS